MKARMTNRTLVPALIFITALFASALPDAHGGDKTVTVDNGADNPVRISDTDNPAQRPYQSSMLIQIPEGESKASASTTNVPVPAGSRAVIAKISVLGEMPVGQKLIGANVNAFIGGSAATEFIGTNFFGTSPAGGVVTTVPVDVYSGSAGPGRVADAGSNTFSATAYRDGTFGSAIIFVQFYGYLVAVP